MKFKKLILASSIIASSLVAQMAVAADTIKVGVLHSLSGTMAISETTLKDTVLMMIEEQKPSGRFIRKTARSGGC